jgi:hypothetical protein
MRYLNGLLVIMIVMVFASCQSRQIKKAAQMNEMRENVFKNHDRCQISRESEILDSLYFPFRLKGLSAKRILKYFSDDTTCDSIDIDKSGYSSCFYTFSDGKSTVTLYLKSRENDEMYLYNSSIKSNFLKTNSSIKMEMSRSEFYKAVDLNFGNCDTVLINEGWVGNSYYFIFRSDKLSAIEIRAQQ